MTEAALPNIRLPHELRPADGRFGSGPSKVRPEAVAALAKVADEFLGTSHRREGVRSVVRRVREGLASLFGLPDGYEIVLGNGGSTLFWDAAAFCLVERRAQHLVFGEFSSKFASVTKKAPFLDDPDVIESATGTHPEAVARDGVDLYALTHNETSTGVMMEITRPAADAFVAVDATSGAGGLPVDATQFDVYYFAPQKALASDGGLFLAACSPAAVERIQRLAGERWVPPTLDLAIALESSRQDQTYNTPALATLFLLAEQVEWINGNGGLEWAAERCRRSSGLLYEWADASEYASPFVTNRADRSATVVTVDFDENVVQADDLAKLLRRNGIVDTESYRKLGRNQLRIATFPAVEPDDVALLTRAIDHIVGSLKG